MTVSNDIVVIIDDDQEVGKIVSDVIGDEGYATRYFSDGESAVTFLRDNEASVIFLDLWFKNDDSAGIEILKKIKEFDKKTPIVIISGHGNIDVAVRVLKLGAYDFIEKPFNLNKLLLTVQRAVELKKLRKENEDLKLQYDFNVYLLGSSREITKVRSVIKKSAQTNSRILISCPPGTGVDLIARYIYENSLRASKSFDTVDCSISDDRLLEELFGTDDKQGVLERLDEGTVFLANVDVLNNDTQSRLLRFLQSGMFQPLGSCTQKRSDVRIISSSSTYDLESRVRSKEYREDLFLRLGVIRIDVPPLSHRREDIPIIANYLVENSERFFNIKCDGIDKSALNMISSYDWPGNVLQLQNALEVACTMAGSNALITESDFPSELSGSAKTSEISDLSRMISLPLKEAREIFERNYIGMQIDRFFGNISQVANFIGMERSALHRKLKSLEISNTKYRSGDEQS